MPLPSFSEDIEKNIIRHIKYRGTIRTGEIIVDNGDGTYDVKIALSDAVYPSIETIHYEMVFAVGEMAVLAFEYGSKESPKIIGHGKKIAQVPVEVEVDYSGAEIDIDIGSPAIDRDGATGPDITVVNRSNPANESGKITSIEIFANIGLSGCKVATFYVASGNNLSTRDYESIGNVPAGSKQVLSVNLDVKAGDYIGIYLTHGLLDVSLDLNGAGVHYWYLTYTDAIPCRNLAFNISENLEPSLYGTGLT
ncbi:hypothetical protein ES708_07492 [subsurface metagenome]